MSQSSRRRFGVLLGGGLTLLLLLLALGGREPAVPVTAARVSTGSLTATVTTNGKVEAIAPITFRARLPAFVREVEAAEGALVRAGAPLLALDADAVVAALAAARERRVSAEDELRSAQAGGKANELAELDSDLATTAADRARLVRQRDALERLVAKQAATREELAESEAALVRAEAEWQRLQKAREELRRRSGVDLERARLLVERAGSELRDLESKVAASTIVAPSAGTLYALPVHVHDFVQTGDLLAELADLARVRVRAFVDEPELAAIQAGQAVEIAWDARSGHSWNGRTEQVPRQIVARGSRSVGEVLCSVENSGLELVPNANVDVRIRVGERASALLVPRGAIEGEGDRRFAFVLPAGGIREGRLERRELKLGIASATQVEVVAGLVEGDWVALQADVPLRDGLRVRPREGP
jgi:multidrug resistance efflux pump